MADSSSFQKAKFGVAGWSFRDWEGVVYPRGIAGDRLSYIARYVDMVEINTTFYRPPNFRQAQGWLRQVESCPGFTFSAKLWQRFTHERGPVEPLDVRTFIDGFEPLVEAGKFATLVFQFPWSFRRTEQSMLHIERLHGAFERFPQAIEVRHASWNNPEFMDFLRKHRIAFINIDQPAIRDTLRPTDHVTAPFSYVRLHGRNERDWFRDDAGRDDRYNYLYSTEELDQWNDRIKKLADQSESVYVIANNHFRGQALANAIELKHISSGIDVSVPEPMFDAYPHLTRFASNPPAQFNLFA